MVKLELQKAALFEKWMNKRVKIAKGTYAGEYAAVKFTALKRVKVQLASDNTGDDLKWKNIESLTIISEEEFWASHQDNGNMPNENATNDNSDNPTVELYNIAESFFQRTLGSSTLGENRFAVAMKDILQEQATVEIEHVQFMAGSKRFLVSFAESEGATLLKANPPVIDGVQCTVHDFTGAQMEEEVLTSTRRNVRRTNDHTPNRAAMPTGGSLFDRMQAAGNDPSAKRRRGDNDETSRSNRRRMNQAPIVRTRL